MVVFLNSYPRTESIAYPSSFDLRGTLKIQRNHPIWGDYVVSLLASGPHAPKLGVDASDHPSITPMRCATEAELGLQIHQNKSSPCSWWRKVFCDWKSCHFTRICNCHAMACCQGGEFTSFNERVRLINVGGILVTNAHRITETCAEAFILRLYPQANEKGWVRAFTDRPQAMVSGFLKTKRIIKSLFVRRLHLWPRFQFSAITILEENPPDVIDIRMPLTSTMEGGSRWQ